MPANVHSEGSHVTAVGVDGAEVGYKVTAFVGDGVGLSDVVVAICGGTDVLSPQSPDDSGHE